MRSLALGVIAALALAGCADDDAGTPGSDCSSYEAALGELVAQNATEEDLVDTDGDCVPDTAETDIGTDPQNVTDVPTAGDFSAFVNGTFQAPLEVTFINGTLAAGVGAGGVGFANGAGGEFPVGENATLIFAEMRWNHPAFDLDLGLDGPDGPDAASGQDFFEHTHDGGGPGTPDSPHSLAIEPTEADWVGTWRVTAFTNGVAAQVDYEVVVTVFYGATAVPEGYTAFPG